MKGLRNDMLKTRQILFTALFLTAPVLVACTENVDSSKTDAAADPRVLTVDSTATACELSASEAPAGRLAFDVTNSGKEIAEFYLLGEDGLQIVAEVENVGPGLTRQLVVEVPAGTYVTACKQGTDGEGIRADFTVTESSAAVSGSTDAQAMVETATEN